MLSSDCSQIGTGSSNSPRSATEFLVCRFLPMFAKSARVRRLMRNAGIRMFCYCQIQDFHRADRRTISERLGQAWCLQWKDMALNKRRSFVVR
jgi:hypothetical protein